MSYGGPWPLMLRSPSGSDDSRASSTLTSGGASTLNSGPLSETSASGSDDPPCRSFHPMTFPRDGHPPLEEALSSGEFPVKPVVTERGGVDEMGPWLRVRATDQLLLCERTVHWSAECPFLQRGTFSLTPCYCVDKLHIGAFTMMWTTTSACMSTVAAAKMWTLQLDGYGPWLSCAGGAVLFRRGPLEHG